MTIKLESASEVEQITESSMIQLVGGGVTDAVAAAAGAAGAAALNTPTSAPRADPSQFPPSALGDFQNFFWPLMLGD